MSKTLFLLLFILPSLGFTQVQKTKELKVVGKPSWDIPITLGKKGLLFLAKSDITKLKVFRLDSDLSLAWEKEFFLDVEKAPTAYTIANDHISLLFSETLGMYYQVFKINLSNGTLEQSGFELREYFIDNDYVFFDDTVIMAGANERGAAFYIYNQEKKTGKLTEKPINGQVKVNSFQFLADQNLIESLWAVKETGYSNEKKKRGPYTKDAYLVYAIFDTTGKLLQKKEIKQEKGKFPTEGKIVNIGGRKMIVGLYQSSVGEKGVFTHDLELQNGLKTFPFSSLLKGNKSLSSNDLKTLYENYTFLANDPVITKDGRFLYGGVFYRAQYNSVTNTDNRGSDPFLLGRRQYLNVRNSSSSRTQQVFVGYNYPTGFMAEFSSTGDLLSKNRVDLNHSASQVDYTLSYNDNGTVGFCTKGDIGISNFNISSKPLIYRLSEEDEKSKMKAFVPSYKSIKHWYGNSFIAVGSRSKIEAISVNDNVRNGVSSTENKRKRRRKKETPSSFSQVQKVYYLTKIVSGF